jgi:hypothetical protein
MGAPLGVRIYMSVVPIQAELAEARQRLTRESCPRRYCWYWHTLSFDWGSGTDKGCEVTDRHIHRLIFERHSGPIPPWLHCGRATGNPQHSDYFEPREPHLEADGWPADYFLVVGKAARQQRYQRLRKGRLRHHRLGED